MGGTKGVNESAASSSPLFAPPPFSPHNHIDRKLTFVASKSGLNSSSNDIHNGARLNCCVCSALSESGIYPSTISLVFLVKFSFHSNIFKLCEGKSRLLAICENE